MVAPALPVRASSSFLGALSTQMRVLGALMMRELHTRYGRENIGYLWLFGEPLILASVMASLHSGSGHTAYGSDIKPVPFTVIGYTTFIMFRGIVNKSEGSLEANGPLLYHRMVTIFDLVLARSLLEAASTVVAYVVLLLLLTGFGVMQFPVRPLYLALALVSMLWFAWAHALIITAASHDNRTVGRLVHPYTYFMIPLSAAFFQVEWIPEPYRTYITWFPLSHILELARYGQFQSGTLKYFDGFYLWSWCIVLTWIGLLMVRYYRERIHLS